MKNHLRRNRLIMAFLFVLSLVGITLRGGAVSYGFFFFCLIVPFLSLCYLLYVYLSFRIYQEVGSKTIVKGQQTLYRFALTNEFFLVYTNVSVSFYSDTSVIDQAPEQERYTLFPGDSVRYETTLTGRFRGEYPAGIREVTVVDYLHLFRIRYQIPSQLRITVLPRIPRLSHPRHFEQLLHQTESDRAVRKEEPDIPVRDYQTGDPLKQVHWKASAKTGMLKVRTRTGLDTLPLALYLDLHPAEAAADEEGTEGWLSRLKEEDTRLECVISLANYFAEKRMPFVVYLPLNGLTAYRVNGPEQFPLLYEQLSAVQFTQTETHSPWELPESVYCIWITGQIGEEWIRTVLDTARTEESLTIVSVAEQPYPHRSFPHHPRITVLPIPCGAKPEEVLD